MDFETSSDDPKTGFPVSLGVALMNPDGAVVSTCKAIIKPPRDKSGALIHKYDDEALAVGGFDLDYLDRAGTPTPVVLWRLHDFATMNYCRDTMIAAYNAPFDMAFYGVLLRFGYTASGTGEWVRPKPPLRGSWHDTRVLALDCLDEVKSLTLSSVAAEIGLPPQPATHDALDDAILNGAVYLKLREWAGYYEGDDDDE